VKNLLLALLLFPAFLFAHPPPTPSPRTGKASSPRSVGVAGQRNDVAGIPQSILPDTRIAITMSWKNCSETTLSGCRFTCDFDFLVLDRDHEFGVVSFGLIGVLRRKICNRFHDL